MKAGIVADNYKVPMFKEELTKAGFSFETSPFNDGATTIKVEYTEEQFYDLHALCAKVNSVTWHKKMGEN